MESSKLVKSVAIQRCKTLGIAASFGFGDRIGLATPGHVEAMKLAGSDILPIFPQQSIREMIRTGRSAEDVMNDALVGMDQTEWKGLSGADADHLKTLADAEVTAAAGFTFFTIDPSDYVDQLTEKYDEISLRYKFSKLRDQIEWWDDYVGKEVALSTGTRISLDEEACMRCAVKYGTAITHVVSIASGIRHLQESANRDYEIELSVDETDQPTTLAEHFIIADQCLRNGVKLVSIAPRFIGDFEKGVDYIGNVSAMERSLNDHAAIARKLGPYKLSLHSGSDKVSIYPALARATKGHFHVKTAGTSYLEALRVVLWHDESLFRSIVDFSRERYNIDKKTYHVSATLDSTPETCVLNDAIELEKAYLERWTDVSAGCGFTAPGRQILHCAFGSVLTHPKLGKLTRDVITSHSEKYTEVLTEHFVRHLQALATGM